MYAKEDISISLVKQARQGDKQSLEKLSELAIAPLQRHVYRIVLREELAQDIVQEVLLEMCQIIDKLREPSRFWPWLYGIAFNKIRHAKRSASRHRTLSLDDFDGPPECQEDTDGLAAVITNELQQSISKSIASLKPEHRAILSMRCYDKMEYAEIAEALGLNIFTVRMKFFRAKKSLAKRLSNNGYSGLSIVIALTVFGKMTAGTEAAAANITISSSSLAVGTTATTVSILSGKTAILAYTVLAALYSGNLIFNKDLLPNTTDINSKSANVIISDLRLIKKDNIPIQHWYYYPQGPNGAVMSQQIAVDSENHVSQCLLLQNHLGSYFSPYSDNKIYLKSYKYFYPDLSVMQLPTDTTAFTNKLERYQGWANPPIGCNKSTKGLLIVLEGFQDNKSKAEWKMLRNYNLLGEDYFKCDWPINSVIIDQRDEIHQQGWAYFTLSGNLGNNKITGEGRIPFNYTSYNHNRPQLKMKIGGKATIIDTGIYAEIKVGGTEKAAYSGGSLFHGLGRPWSGLHTIDTIRRDAIQENLHFTTELLPGDKDVRITVTKDVSCKLIYTIDLYKDLLKEIIIESSDGNGRIAFSYTTEKDDYTLSKLDNISPAASKTARSTGINWLTSLPEVINQ